jgi:branched-chain amino acid transport system permease protein
VLLIALAIGAGVSLVVERFTYRWQRSSDHIVPLVSSMAFLILIENLVLIYWGSDLQAVQPPFENVSVRIGHLLFSVPQLLALVIAVSLVGGLSIVLKCTSVGRGLRAIAEDTDTAIMLGVDVFKVVPAVFLISGVFSALGGVLFAVNYQQVSFNMGEAVALKGIAAMVVGGMGNIWGAILGGLLIGVVEALSTSWFGADFSKIAVYGLLIAILVVRPTGLLGGVTLGRARL